MPSRGWAVAIAALSGLGSLVFGAGIEVSPYQNGRLALILLSLGGFLLFLSVLATVYFLVTNRPAPSSGVSASAKADHGSMAQAAGRDAINVGNIVQSPAEPAPIYIDRPETKGFLGAGIWWEYVRYQPHSLLLGRRVPEVQPFCPEHRDYHLQFQPHSGMGCGKMRPLQRSDWPATAQSRGGGYMVCVHGKGHDVFLEAGTDNLDNAWARAEAKIAAQIRGGPDA